MSHTPGPWRISEKDHGCSVEPSIAWCGKTTAHRDHEANARLIAAAPDMLEALMVIRDQGGQPGKLACDAISKAEGIR